jgi:antitoxin ParD1/3/4
MGTTRKTITLTDKQDQWIKAQIAAGEYTNDSEYIRDLVRRDQEENAKFLALKQAIQEGLSSGVSDKSVTDIMEEVESRLRADGRL